MLSNLKYILITATLLCGVACDKSTPTPGNGNEQGGENTTTQYTEINGTDIDPKNNAIGLISDSSTGKGIAGIPVTDGYTFTTTDANGVYQFNANRWARRVYFTLPSEYKVPVDPENGRPIFYSAKDINYKQQNRNDFTLTPLDKPEDEFTILAIGDPQCEVASEADRFRNETINDIKSTMAFAQNTMDKYHNAYAITMGDITFDNTSLWPTMAELCSSIDIGNGNVIPVFNCIGNHDHDASRDGDRNATELYVQNVGPTDYSFNRGKVHFVVMDNVICTKSSGGSWDYNAGYSAQQYNWLVKDLELVENKAEKMIILSSHIPFRYGDNSGGSNVNFERYYAEILTLLTQFKEAHIFIGHTHYPQNYIHTKYKTKNGQPIIEHVHGAACGGWWTCNIGVDGSPNSYSIYQVKGATLHNWVAKAVGHQESMQMRVYNGNDSYGHKYKYNWLTGGVGGSSNIKTNGNSAMKNCFIATIWNDDTVNWKVDLIVGDKVYPMKRITTSLADMCSTAYFFNEKGKNTNTWNKALTHYWYIEAPCGDPAKEVAWQVRATHTVAGGQIQNVYTESSFTSTYAGF